MKIKLACVLERVCGSTPQLCLATVKGRGEFHVHIAFDCRGNQQDLGLPVGSSWLQKSLVELEEGELWFLHEDIGVPCIMRTVVVFCSEHLNKVLITIGALRSCFDKTIIKAMETTRRGQSSWKHKRAIMVKNHARVAWRLDKDMNGWYLGRQPYLLAENEDGDLNHGIKEFAEPSIEFRFFVNGKKCARSAVDVVCPLVVVVRILCSVARDSAAQVFGSNSREDVLAPAPGTRDRRTSVQISSNQCSGMGREESLFRINSTGCHVPSL